MTADGLYDDALETIQRKRNGDSNVTDAEYQVAKDILAPVFISIRYDRENMYPSTITDNEP